MAVYLNRHIFVMILSLGANPLCLEQFLFQKGHDVWKEKQNVPKCVSLVHYGSLCISPCFSIKYDTTVILQELVSFFFFFFFFFFFISFYLCVNTNYPCTN